MYFIPSLPYTPGINILNVIYQYLDLVPKGRGGDGHDFPQFWMRLHDAYNI
jgi:predicted dithiol-disulfide oxidoreductase (DUF899 family)